MKIVAALLVILSLLFELNAQDTLLYEDFSAGEFPAGWSNINNDGHTVNAAVSDFADPWVVVEDPQNPSNFVVGSTSYFEPVDRADRWLISPEVTLEGSGNFISWYGRSHDPSFPDSYRVMISTTGDALSDFTDTLVIVSQEFPTGILRTLEIDEKFADSTIRFAFVNNTFNGFKLYLDSIYVRTGDPLTTNEINLVSLQVYPNPATDVIHVNGGEVAMLALYSATGQLEAIAENSNSIDVTDVNKGLYFLRVYLKNGEVVPPSKVIIR